MKNNFKEISHLLRVSQDKEFVKIIDFFKLNNSGVGTILATKDMYFTLLDKLLNKESGKGDAYWVMKPSGTSKGNLIYKWLCDINLDYLVQYSSKTTLRRAFSCLHKSGLLHIDKYNRLHIKYPVDGKLLSPKFAATAILAKKKKALDEKQKEGVLSESEDQEQEDFWNKIND